MSIQNIAITFIGLVYLTMLLPVASSAQPAQQPPRDKANQGDVQNNMPVQRPPFTQLDRDQNGFLNKEEAKPVFPQEQAFSQADINKDQRLSQQEFDESAAQGQEASPEAANQAGPATAQPENGQQQAETPSTMQVEQQKPEIAVSQPAPKIIVDQPTPQIIVKQLEPQVTIKQEEPQVTVKQPGQPEVIVQQAEQPDVTVIEGTGESSGPENQLYNMTVEEVVGKDVVTTNGETVGEIDQVVLHSDDKELYVVVPVGGFLGIGEKEVVVPISELELVNDQVTVTSAENEGQLEQKPAYDPNQYTVLEERHSIGEFAGNPSR